MIPTESQSGQATAAGVGTRFAEMKWAMPGSATRRPDGQVFQATELSAGDKNLPAPANFAAVDGKELPPTSPGKLESARLDEAAKVALVARTEEGKAQVRPESPDQVRHDGVVASNPVPAPVQQTPTVVVTPSVGSREWSGAVGEKVVWMVNQNHQVAELHLNPPNLGPVEVRLTMNNDQASAMFVAHHPVAREAIETALPRLREMLAESGIMLGNATVGAESFGQQQQASGEQAGDGRGFGRSGGQMAQQVAAPPITESVARRSLLDGVVDTFA